MESYLNRKTLEQAGNAFRAYTGKDRVRSPARSFDVRLRQHYQQGIDFYVLESAMYPHESFPRYWRYSGNGGPPGGRMAFVPALKRRGIRVVDEGTVVRVRRCYGSLQEHPHG